MAEPALIRPLSSLMFESDTKNHPFWLLSVLISLPSTPVRANPSISGFILFEESKFAPGATVLAKETTKNDIIKFLLTAKFRSEKPFQENALKTTTQKIFSIIRPCSNVNVATTVRFAAFNQIDERFPKSTYKYNRFRLVHKTFIF